MFVIASGRANHAGSGGWRGLSGNSSVYGLECENVGTTAEPWTATQIDAMVRCHVAFIQGTRNPNPDLVCQHKEWTSRKPDAHSINGNTFRSQVRAALGGAPRPPVPGPGPGPGPTPPPEEDDEVSAVVIAPDGRYWCTAGCLRTEIDKATRDTMVFMGAKEVDANDQFWHAIMDSTVDAHNIDLAYVYAKAAADQTAKTS
jgi:hypothetical protein